MRREGRRHRRHVEGRMPERPVCLHSHRPHGFRWQNLVWVAAVFVAIVMVHGAAISGDLKKLDGGFTSRPQNGHSIVSSSMPHLKISGLLLKALDMPSPPLSVQKWNVHIKHAKETICNILGHGRLPRSHPGNFTR
jgi:hypothetical protein